MPRLFSLTAVLLLAAGIVTAQPSTPSTVKSNTKKGRQTEAARTPAAVTDWSLPYAATITAEGLKKDLDILASDAYEGRETGQKGQKMAADYLANAFASYGLPGPVPNSDNAYLQHFDMNRSVLDAGASTAKVGGNTYQTNQDFYPFLADGTFAAPTAVNPVFIGYGIREEKYSDFTNATDYRGKNVVLLLSEPLDATGKFV